MVGEPTYTRVALGHNVRSLIGYSASPFSRANQRRTSHGLGSRI